MAVYVLRRIVDQFPEGKLCMVGGAKDSSFDSVKLKIAELGLQNNIEFTGSIPRKNWIEMSSDYDVFINTTNADNMPVSLVEALALGIPIVTTNPGGIPFLLEHRLDALICKCNDVDEMTSYVLELLDNGELASHLSENGRKKAERYSWASIQTAWYDLLSGYEVRKK
jgi:glycosyltransferase involved in cell wall biosynthesis